MRTLAIFALFALPAGAFAGPPISVTVVKTGPNKWLVAGSVPGNPAGANVFIRAPGSNVAFQGGTWLGLYRGDFTKSDGTFAFEIESPYGGYPAFVYVKDSATVSPATVILPP